LARFHGIIVCVLGSKQGPPITPLQTWIVTLAVVVPFVVVVVKFIFGITAMYSKRCYICNSQGLFFLQYIISTMKEYPKQDKINNNQFVVIVVVIIMSEFAFFRFRSNNMLSVEEEQHKDEIIELTEEVLEAKGIECDSKISKISERQLREILEEVRKLRRKRKRLSKADNRTSSDIENEELEHQNEEEIPYIR
jgi:hypothetical protein